MASSTPTTSASASPQTVAKPVAPRWCTWLGNVRTKTSRDLRRQRKDVLGRVRELPDDLPDRDEDARRRASTSRRSPRPGWREVHAGGVTAAPSTRLRCRRARRPTGARTRGCDRSSRPRGRGRSTSNVRTMRPGRALITMMLSESSTDSEMLCVTKITVVLAHVPDLLELEAHALARDHVERAEWLVHQDERRIEQQRAADRDPLLHAAGQLVRAARLESGQAGELDQFERAAPVFGRRIRRASRRRRGCCRACSARASAPATGTPCRRR